MTISMSKKASERSEGPPRASSAPSGGSAAHAVASVGAHRTRIKICGLTREQDVDAAVAAGADAVGFIQYAKSPRHVTIARAVELAARLPPFVTPAPLYVGAGPQRVPDALGRLPNAWAKVH